MCITNQRFGIDARHQIQRVEKFLSASGQIMTIERIRDGSLDGRHVDLQAQAINGRDAIRR